ncbi:glucose 1-dehydrogenase [uncultured Agrococcus sp.]|uniref:glucose 1-dehydrogenase n=1 Tax=uncultured Agrococcus sp. TaxID=382258 RepID=UPI0025EF17B0|nr:glucose 1-dehydrogenase [uncultured Agrococcus sp.]
MSLFALNDKVAIITGAGSGIGRATATMFAEHGARVVVSDIADTAEETVKLIVEAGGEALAVIGDISDPTVAEQLVDQAAETFGRVDILVNNAGIMDNFAGAADLDDAVLDRVLRVNTLAPLYLTRAALPGMRERGSGSIVNVASAAGIRGAAAGAAYTMSKHAIVGLTKNTAYTYAHDGVRANAIAPGGVATNVMTPELQKTIHGPSMERITPVHQSALRNAEPEEQAAAILFLASDAASDVNGVIMPTDGGWAAG